jgi:hypothetical protein
MDGRTSASGHRASAAEFVVVAKGPRAEDEDAEVEGVDVEEGCKARWVTGRLGITNLSSSEVES